MNTKQGHKEDTKPYRPEQKSMYKCRKEYTLNERYAHFLASTHA